MLFGPMRIKMQGWNETSRVFICHAPKFKITSPIFNFQPAFPAPFAPRSASKQQFCSSLAVLSIDVQLDLTLLFSFQPTPAPPTMMPRSPRPHPTFPNPKNGSFLVNFIIVSTPPQRHPWLQPARRRAAPGCFLALFDQQEYRPRGSAAPQWGGKIERPNNN